MDPVTMTLSILLFVSEMLPFMMTHSNGILHWFFVCLYGCVTAVQKEIEKRPSMKARLKHQRSSSPESKEKPT